MNNIDDFERSFDDFYNRPSLTTNNRNLALWRVLTVFEDVSFMVFMDYLDQADDEDKHKHELKVSSFMDAYKFHLKNILKRIYNESDDLTPCATDKLFQGGVYRKISKAYSRSELYRLICLHFTALRSGAAKATISNKKIAINYTRSHEVHTFLQYCGYVKFDVTDLPYHGYEVVARMIKKPPKELINEARNSCRIEGVKPVYDFSETVVNYLYEKISPSLIDLPEKWIFPWSTLNEFRYYAKALSALCANHIFMNAVATEKYNIRGGGVENRLFVISQRKLNEQIWKLTEMSATTVEKITQHLIYGFGVNNPDPALQPLIPYNDDLILSPFSVTTLNFERNALALHLRLYSKNFDNQSYLFEKNMTKDFISRLSNRFRYKTSFKLMHSKGGEIDVVVVDEMSKCIVICELKWMLTPADPNEILGKIKESDHKINQAIRKADESRKQISYILKTFNINGTGEGWDVYSFAVFEGFPGVEHYDGTETIALPIDTFFMLLNSSSSLKVFCEFVKKGDWLPVEGVHYSNHKITYTFGGVQVEIDRVELIDLLGYIFYHIPNSISDNL